MAYDAGGTRPPGLQMKGASMGSFYLSALRNLSALNNIMIKLVPCGASPDTVRSPLSL